MSATKKKQGGFDRLRRTGQFLLDAMSGRLGILMMTFSYVAFAVVLLAYVSTQVYTNSLLEDITARKRDERSLRENISRLTAQYASLSARSRVSGYCEKHLDMMEPDVSQVVRVLVEPGEGFGAVETFGHDPVRGAGVLGAELGALTEGMTR